MLCIIFSLGWFHWNIPVFYFLFIYLYHSLSIFFIIECFWKEYEIFKALGNGGWLSISYAAIFTTSFDIPAFLTPFVSTATRVPSLQSAIFEFCDLDTNEHFVLNHLLLIFKLYIYNAITTGYLNISHNDIRMSEWCKKEKKINKKGKDILMI